jgi:hypothetical protein
MGPDPQPNSSSALPRGKPRTERLFYLPPYPQCSRCGNTVPFERIASFAQAVHDRFVIASCETGGCKLQGVRLKVPVRTIECEVL